VDDYVYSEHSWPAAQPLTSPVVTVYKHLLLTLKKLCILPLRWSTCVIWLSQWKQIISVNSIHIPI